MIGVCQQRTLRGGQGEDLLYDDGDDDVDDDDDDDDDDQV